MEVIPYMVSAISVILLTLYVFAFYPRNRTNNMFVLMGVTASWWGTGYVFEILAIDSPTMVFWLYVQYFAIMFLPVSFFLFSLSFTHYAEYFFADRRRLVPFFFPGMGIYVVVLTNSLHELFFENIRVHEAAAFPSLTYSAGPLFWAFIIFSAAIVSIGVLILTRSYQLNPHPLHKKQIIVILVAISAVVGSIVIDVVELLPFSVYLNITPLAFMAFSIIFLFGLYNFDLLGILPAAHNLIFRTTNLGIVITTLDHRVIEINPKGWSYITGQSFKESRESVKGTNFFSLLRKQQNLTPYAEQIQHIEESIVKLTEKPKERFTF
jgi:hypothetical protein